MLKIIKEFVSDLLINSWFKIIVFLLLCFVLYNILDCSKIHLEYVHTLEKQLAAGEITYEQADFLRSATHEQIVYQIAMSIIVAMTFIAGLLMEQNSKLRERVKRVDFRLWKLDRNVEEIYELQRTSYERQYEQYEPYDYDDVEDDDIDKNMKIKRELERLQEEKNKLIEEVQQLEKKYIAKKMNKKEE